MDSKLDWNYHIGIVRNKVAKNVSVMNRVKHVLTSSALYSHHCTLVMPYLTYCCEVWGNNYKTRIQSLFILQERAIRICLNTNYKCHTKPLFYQLRSLKGALYRIQILCRRYTFWSYPAGITKAEESPSLFTPLSHQYRRVYSHHTKFYTVPI